LGGPLSISEAEGARSAASDRLGRAIYELEQDGVRELCAALIEAMGSDRQAELDHRFASDRPMTWAQVKGLHEAGVEIGAHAHDHAILHRGQPQVEIEHQVLTSKTLIEDKIGRCRYFAYPVGNVAHIGPKALEAVRNAGFDAAFSTIAGTLSASRDDHLLPRVMLHRDSRADAFNFPFVNLRYDGTLPQRQAAVSA
jgi:peptidoglycan/xylan/chitin deacetylase (PgdA/CDA1 family)